MFASFVEICWRFVGQNIRRPMPSPSGQNRRASRSSMTIVLEAGRLSRSSK